MDENQQKSWYAVITADVLYDKNLTARQKLLMAVISNMSNEKGYCFASNKYLSELMCVSISSVQRDLSVLEENYLNRVVKLKPNGEVEYRALTPVSHMNRGSVTHATTPHSTHDHIITNSSNNKLNTQFSEKFKFLYETYLSESGHTPSSQSRIKSEQAWIELTDEERRIAVEQCEPFLKHKKREMIRKDGIVNSQFIPRVYTYLENKYFIGTDYTGEEVSVTQDIDPTTGTMVTIYRDKNERRLNESQVYFDRDERKYYKAV